MKRIFWTFLCLLVIIATCFGIALAFKSSNSHVILTDGHPVDVQIMAAGCVSSDQYWAKTYSEKNIRVLVFKADLYRCQFQDQKNYELSTQGYYLVVFH